MKEINADANSMAELLERYEKEQPFVATFFLEDGYHLYFRGVNRSGVVYAMIAVLTQLAKEFNHIDFKGAINNLELVMEEIQKSLSVL